MTFPSCGMRLESFKEHLINCFKSTLIHEHGIKVRKTMHYLPPFGSLFWASWVKTFHCTHLLWLLLEAVGRAGEETIPKWGACPLKNTKVLASFSHFLIWRA